MTCKQNSFFVLFVVFFITLSAISLRAEVSQYLEGYCADRFTFDGTCDETACAKRCLGDLIFEGCPEECVAKTCVELDIQNCPKDACQVLDGCDGRQACYYKIEDAGLMCGTLAYAGNRVECCDGFEKRCGTESFDGSCDMEGADSMTCVPLCLPCGDGLCGTLENKCNCPEDCS
ncbi:hypothetical protein ACFL49_00345 [Candidatus Omnitrophota bacterium]